MESFFGGQGAYPTLPVTGGSGKDPVPWQAAPCPKECYQGKVEVCGSFDCVGYLPAGPVRFGYACNVQHDHVAKLRGALYRFEDGLVFAQVFERGVEGLFGDFVP
jgi:hypothetical protein